MSPEEQVAYIRKLLGTKYKLNSSDPAEGLDCLTCTRKIQLEVFGNYLPELQIEDDTPQAFIKAVIKGKAAADWIQIPEPMHGCVVELSRGLTPHHIGTYFELPTMGIKGLVHCIKGGGVCYDPWHTMKAAGWRGFKYDVPRNS